MEMELIEDLFARLPALLAKSKAHTEFIYYNAAAIQTQMDALDALRGYEAGGKRTKQ